MPSNYRLPAIGESCRLYTAFVIKEYSQSLYGFLEEEQRDLFEWLITLSGIGPKTALNMLSHFSLEDFHLIVQEQDIAAFAKVPGIGKKTAEKLLLEFKGRFKGVLSIKGNKDHLQDALGALLNLGYSQVAAEKAIKRACEDVEDPHDLSTLITVALKYQGL